jgi:hypothetical protein
MDFYSLVADVGFPTAAAVSAGYFVFLTLKFILAGVTSSVKSLSIMIHALEERVKTMNHDVLRIDVRISSALGMKPDMQRVSRSEQEDMRKD